MIDNLDKINNTRIIATSPPLELTQDKITPYAYTVRRADTRVPIKRFVDENDARNYLNNEGAHS